MPKDDKDTKKNGADSLENSADNPGKVAALTPEQVEQKALEERQNALNLEALAAKEKENHALAAELAQAEKDKAKLSEDLAATTARAEAAETELARLRVKFQQDKVQSVELDKGQAQLLECVTLFGMNGSRVDGRVGDIILRGGDSSEVSKAQKKHGTAYRVFAIQPDNFDETVAAKGLATVRA